MQKVKIGSNQESNNETEAKSKEAEAQLEERKEGHSESKEYKYANYFDTIIMNPPFGTKNNAGIDLALLKTAALRGLKPGG